LSIAPYSPGRQRGASATWRTEKVLTTRRAGQTMRHAKNGPLRHGRLLAVQNVSSLEKLADHPCVSKLIDPPLFDTYI
jgi:hypothetical protein